MFGNSHREFLWFDEKKKDRRAGFCATIFDGYGFLAFSWRAFNRASKSSSFFLFECISPASYFSLIFSISLDTNFTLDIPFVKSSKFCLWVLSSSQIFLLFNLNVDLDALFIENTDVLCRFGLGAKRKKKKSYVASNYDLFIPLMIPFCYDAQFTAFHKRQLLETFQVGRMASTVGTAIAEAIFYYWIVAGLSHSLNFKS